MKFNQQLHRTLYYSFSVIFLSLIILSCDSDDLSPDMDDPVVIGDDPVVNPSDKLSQIAINTHGNVIVDDPKINAEITISKADVISYKGDIGIEIRGASSQSFPKKSYGLETRDGNNADLNVSLLDLPEEEDWVLHAPYTDKSLMRNMLIYDLSRDINMYASRSVFVELTINNSYKGLYVFMEKLKRNKDRINIKKLKPEENSGEDLTGGYILKIDKIAGNNLGEGYNSQNSFESQHSPYNASNSGKIYFLYEYPKAKEITSEQKNYISTYVKGFENALSSDNFTDINLGYEAHIDVASFIDFFLLNELSNNVDGYRLSTYMHKDKNEKLKMGPIWDFNLAFGNADYCGGGSSNVWAYQFNQRCSGDYWQVPFWWARLLQDPAYVDQVKSRWNELRGGAFSEASIIGKIETYTNTLNTAGAIDQNFNTWKILGTYIWPNNYIGTTYTEENDYLKDWVKDRLSWLDTAISGL